MPISKVKTNSIADGVIAEEKITNGASGGSGIVIIRYAI